MNRSHARGLRRTSALSLAAVAVVASAPAFAATLLTTAAFSNNTTFGTGLTGQIFQNSLVTTGGVTTNFTTPIINNAGQVVFQAGYGAAGSSYGGFNNGLFRYTPGVGNQVAMVGGNTIANSAALSAGGIAYRAVDPALQGFGNVANSVAITDNGTIVSRVSGTVSGTGSTVLHLVTAAPGATPGTTSVSALAVNGGATPLASINYGTTASGLATQGPYVSPSGRILTTSPLSSSVTGLLTGTGTNANNSALFVGNAVTGAPLSLGIQRNFAFSPETRAGALGVSLTNSSINNAGNWAYTVATTLQGADITTATTGNPRINNQNAIVTNLSGSPTILVQGNAAVSAPGVTSAAFDSFDNVRLNDNGVVAFSAALKSNAVSGSTITTATNAGLFIASAGSDPTLLLQKGKPAPGLVETALVSTIGNIQNHTNFLFFSATTTGTSGTTFFRYSYADQSITAVASSLIPIPGLPGLTGAIGNFTSNNQGRFAFTYQMGTNTALGIDQTNHYALVATDDSGVGLQVLARTGTNFTIPGVGTRQVGIGAIVGGTPSNNLPAISLAAGSLSTGLNTALNDNNILTFGLAFYQPASFPLVPSPIVSNGIFTVAIPEPSAMALLLLPVAGLARRRR